MGCAAIAGRLCAALMASFGAEGRRPPVALSTSQTVRRTSALSIFWHPAVARESRCSHGAVKPGFPSTPSPASTPTAPRTTSPSRAGRASPGPTPAPCCPSTATPTPSSTTARWARSSKPSWPSPTSNGKPQASSTAAAPCGAWRLLDEPITLPGDDSPTLPYLAITNRHDGTAACALRATAVRIVCANTFRAAELEGERTGTTFSFIHKSSWRNRIDEARQAVTGARKEMQPLHRTRHRAPRHPHQRSAAGTVHHRVHPHAARRAGHRPGSPQRRASPQRRPAALPSPRPPSRSPEPPMGSFRPQANTSTTYAPRGPGKPGSTAP